MKIQQINEHSSKLPIYAESDAVVTLEDGREIECTIVKITREFKSKESTLNKYNMRFHLVPKQPLKH